MSRTHFQFLLIRSILASLFVEDSVQHFSLNTQDVQTSLILIIRSEVMLIYAAKISIILSFLTGFLYSY